MSPIFKYVAAHNIIKKSNEPIEAVKYGELYDINDTKTLTLAESIHSSFGKPSNRPDIGRYKHLNDRGQFADKCAKYACNPTNSEEEFLQLSKFFTIKLNDALSQSRLIQAIGGYIVCLHYTSDNNEDFLLFAIIRDENRLIFTENLQLTETATINTDKLRLAFRIKLKTLREFIEHETKLEDGELVDPDLPLDFLHIIASSESDKTNYFAGIIGYSKGLNSKQSTDSLFSFIENTFREKPQLASKVEEAKEKTAQLFIEKGSNPVTLDDLVVFYRSNYGDFINDPQERDDFFGKFADTMTGDKYGIPLTFIGHKPSYSKHTHTTLISDSYEIKLRNTGISTRKEDSQVYWNKEENYINIRIEVTDEIKEQLKDIA